MQFAFVESRKNGACVLIPLSVYVSQYVAERHNTLFGT